MNSHRFLLFLGGVAKGSFVCGAIGTTIMVHKIIGHIENEELQLAHRLRGMEERMYASRQDIFLLDQKLDDLRKIVKEGITN
jgi:hypothetical protein